MGRLAQGNVHGVSSTDTLEFVYKHKVPAQRSITYATFVCDYKSLNNDQYRVRLVAGGQVRV